MSMVMCMVAQDKKIQKLYIVTKDKEGHLHHYSSSKASMHLDIVLEHDIDLDKETLIEKGFIFSDKKITANYDIRGDKVRQERKKRKDGRK